MTKKQIVLTIFVCLLIAVGTIFFTNYRYKKMKKETNKKIEKIENKQKNKKKNKNKKNEKKNMKKKEKSKKEKKNIKKNKNSKNENENIKKNNNSQSNHKNKKNKNKEIEENSSEQEEDIDRYKVTLQIDEKDLESIAIKKEDIISKTREFTIDKGLMNESFITYVSSKVSALNDKRVYYYFELRNVDLNDAVLQYTIEKYNDELFVRDGFYENE